MRTALLARGAHRVRPTQRAERPRPPREPRPAGIPATQLTALRALAVGALMVAGALTWLLGPWGLLLSGLLVITVALVGIDVDGGARGDAASHPARPSP